MITPTEQRNPRTLAIDAVGTTEILRMVNAEDASGRRCRRVPSSRELAEAVDCAVEAVRRGGRVHYFGAGTSGRLAVLDAAELLPTFHVPDDLVVAHHAGGMEALLRAVENVEDSEEGGADDAAPVTARDIVDRPRRLRQYAVRRGRAAKPPARSAPTTVLVTSNPEAPLAPLADIVIAADTGPEVIAGSTRLKAGTAQKMILNAFSTTLMIKLGRTWSNLMVDLVATNAQTPRPDAPHPRRGHRRRRGRLRDRPGRRRRRTQASPRPPADRRPRSPPPETPSTPPRPSSRSPNHPQRPRIARLRRNDTASGRRQPFGASGATRIACPPTVVTATAV